MKAIIKNKLDGNIVSVTSTTEHPDSSYGQAVWVDDNNNSYCVVGMEAPMYEVVKATIEDRETLGQMLRTMRVAKGVSIRDLAERSGLNKNTIVNVEGGKFTPRLDIIIAMTKALGVNINIGL